MTRLCTLRQMRYFIAVVEQGSFRRASTELHIAQPALSRAVQELEETLKTQLLVRSKNGVLPTEAGKAFFEGSAVEIRRIGDLMTQVHHMRDGVAGGIAIGYTDFAIGGVLPGLLNRYRARYPRVSLELQNMVTGAQLTALKEGQIDLGFGTGPVAEPGFGQMTIQQDRLVVVLSRHHRLARLSEIELRVLANEDFIMGESVTWRHFMNHIQSACLRAGFMPNIVQEAYNSEGIFGLVAAGMGVTLHVESSRNYIRKGLVVRPLKNNHYLIPTVAQWRLDNASKLLSNLLSFLKSA